ncbi:MAG: hypothetical protein WD063_11685 [Pirellulales bacterium]
MSKATRTHRGDLMRQIAAMHAKINLTQRRGESFEQSVAERQELKKKIVDLMQQVMR